MRSWVVNVWWSTFPHRHLGIGERRSKKEREEIIKTKKNVIYVRYNRYVGRGRRWDRCCTDRERDSRRPRGWERERERKRVSERANCRPIRFILNRLWNRILLLVYEHCLGNVLSTFFSDACTRVWTDLAWRTNWVQVVSSSSSDI